MNPTLSKFLTVSAILVIGTSAFAGLANVSLVWNANPEPDIAGYKVHWGTASGVYTQFENVLQNTAVVPNLIIGVRYYFSVTAYNQVGLESVYSQEVSTVVLAPPTPTPTPTSTPTPTPTPAAKPVAPSNLAAVAISSSRIDLSWTDNSDNETEFRVQRSTDGVNFTLFATVGANVTTYSNTGLAASTKYYYRVRSYNRTGVSPVSNVASARTSAASTPTPTPTPTPTLAAPSAMLATATSSTQMSLTWSDNSSRETGFRIQRSTDGTTFTLIATVGANITSYLDTGLTASTKYYYRVRAYTSGVNSAFSNITSATTLAERLESESLKVQSITPAPSGYLSTQWFGVFNATAASGGAGTYFNATAPGQFITYTVPVAKAGTYHVQVGIRTKPNKGIWQLRINGLNIGQPQDEYYPSITYGVRDLGAAAFSVAGNYAFKFTVAGKNVSSSGYTLAFDYIDLVPE